MNNQIQKVVAVISAVIFGVSVMPVAVFAQADYSCCSSDSTYTPSYDSTYTPSYDSTYTPSYDSTYTPSYDSTYTPSYDSTYTPSYDSTFTPSSDIYGNVTTDISGVGYSFNDYGGGYYPSYGSTPSYSYATPITITAPRYSNTTIVQQPQQQQQQQSQQQSINLPININNTNTNINNNTAPVTPVYQTPISYPVQYIAPQPIYYPQQPYYYQNYQNVSCTITASPTTVQAGQYVYLTWQSYGASYAQLSNVGNVAPSGSWSTRVNGQMNFVLTVYGQNGQQATCNTYVTVNQVQPYVTLSQIPYTGFDFGTMGDAIYWASLLAFALSLAYLAIYFRGGTLAFAGASMRMPKISLPSMPTLRFAKKEVAHTYAPAPVATHAGSPVQKFELPTAGSRHTIDAMSIDKSNGAPRIVITRS